MRRYLLLTVTLTLAVFLVTSIAPTLLSFSGSAAYAQGPFGRKSTGKTDEQRKEEELKKEKEKEAQAKKEEEKKAHEEQERAKKETTEKTTKKNDSEGKEVIKSGERNTDTGEDSNSKTSSGDRKTPDARPSQERTTSRDADRNSKTGGDDSVYKRVEERPEIKSHRRPHHDCYPYDPDWVIIYPRRYPYPYPPLPDRTTEELTIQQLIDGISHAWLDNTPEVIYYLLPAKKEIKIYKDKEHLCNMKPDDFYASTVEAMNDWLTVEYKLDIVKYRWNKIIARGYHTYKGYDPESVIYRSDVYYVLELERKQWVITETGFTSVEEVGRGSVDR